MSLPYVIPLVIEYPSGTALSNIQVTLRNQSTNDTLMNLTDGDGKITFDCSNFTKGYTVGDVVEWTVSYSAYEGDGFHEIVAGGGMAEETLVLAAYPAIPQLRYFVPKDFYDYFDLKPYEDTWKEGIKARRLAIVGEGVEADIDGDSNTQFDSGNTVTDEYHDVRSDHHFFWFLNKGPIQSVTTVEINSSLEGNVPSWTELDADNNDYEYDAETSRLSITNIANFPEVGQRNLRITYVYGRSTVPKDIKMLAILETGFRLNGSNFIRHLVTGVKPGETTREAFFRTRERIMNKYRQGYARSV